MHRADLPHDEAHAASSDAHATPTDSRAAGSAAPSGDQPLGGLRLSQEPLEREAYRGVSRAAVAALVLGVASAAVMSGAAVLVVIPLSGLFVGLSALARLADPEQRQAGRSLALTGMGLSTMFLIGGPLHWWMDGLWLSREARPVAQQWIEFLRHGQPQWALQLEQLPAARRPLDAGLVDYYRSPESYEKLKNFVKQPLVRLLLELNDEAQVRFCQTLRVGRGTNKDEVTQLYAVTFPLEGQRTTLFAFVGLERRGDVESAVEAWSVVDYGVATPPTEDR